MRKLKTTIESEHLNKQMNIGVYGHFGFAVLLFPSLTDDFDENEESGLIVSLDHFINGGRIKIYTVDTVNSESFWGNGKNPEEKSARLFEFNNFIIDEVVPLIYGDCGGPIPILTAGCSTGAFHAANQYFRRPDVFLGTIALSGKYDITEFTNGYFDDNCYFNSPVHYLPNLTDRYWLSFLVAKNHVYLASGTGEGEEYGHTADLSDVLTIKNIPHVNEKWDAGYKHDIKSWEKMLPDYISRKF